MYRILQDVNSPKDIKNLSNDKLDLLANDIRKFLIDNISKTGGHFASNLGVVELTIALHRVFDSPKDKLIWDVGHQGYVHKILTGRKDKFTSLRQIDGLSGFLKSSESEHDVFNAGHSSTSISAGLGMVISRELNQEDNNVVSIIGDGALTGGMALEALNHAGSLGKKFIVILNDNNMSISQNVGSLSKVLTKLRSDPAYFRLKEDVEKVLNKVPCVGKEAVKAIQKVKTGLKHTLIRTGIFEEMGFNYLGPVDGHDIQGLTEILSTARDMNDPVLIHVITKKGNGYKSAELDPGTYHGVSCFSPDKGICKSDKITYSKVFGNKLIQMAENDKDIVAISAAMPSGTGLTEFSNKYKDRFFDVGIAEQHGATFAAGLAKEGKKPYFAVYSTFMQRAYDQILHDICLQELSVKLCLDRAGIVGNDGETHHGIYDISYLSTMPNMTLLAPMDGIELEGALEYVNNFNGPIAIRYPRGEVKNVERESIDLTYTTDPEKFGEGNDFLIVAVGNMVIRGLEIVESLKERNINGSVINPKLAYPIKNDKLFEMINSYDNVYTLEDNIITGGFGSNLLMECTGKNMKFNKFNIFAFPNIQIVHGDVTSLYKKYGLDTKSLVEKIFEDFK
ncbi:MAG: 1-deoxy-D-xylulose-5-phosphate synthase [Firmicutes bacterium]|jgi:1-deoxy-D-xylulose-5-phosphate synthase|nr:1-deoxy-D-xylulose-5-phosphate synthase [Bacillota bacterium]